jgi:predicted dehydrogenase
VLSVRAEAGQYLPSWRPGLDYRSVVSAHRELGGGVLLELSHELDYLRWLFGEVCWVQARLARQSALQIDVEDTVHMLLGFERRAGDSELTASLNIDFIRHDAVRQCTVIGEEGSLRWNARAGTVEFFQPGDAAWRGVFDRPEARDDTYIAVWKHLLECVETGAAPLVSGEDGLSVLRIIDAARESSQRNRTVTVGSPGT